MLPEMTSTEMTSPEVTWPEEMWPEVTSVTVAGRDVITRSDVIFPRFFLTIVVVQNVPWHEKLEDTKEIIRSRKSNDKQQWDIFYYSYSKKKARGKWRHFRLWRHVRSRWLTSLPVTSLPVTSLPATSFPLTSLPVAHLSQIMMAYRSSKQSSTDQTHSMPPQQPQYSQSNDEEPYYILKTNNPFLFCNVFYVI